MLGARVALVSLFLCAALQVASSPGAVDRRCLLDLPLVIREIWRSAPVQWSDTTLYTPTLDNYTNCPVATLKCFADELKVLIKEWEITNVHLQHSSGTLYKTSSRFHQPDAECLHCELLQERKAETFLDGLLEVLQKMNAQFCKQTNRQSPRRHVQDGRGAPTQLGGLRGPATWSGPPGIFRKNSGSSKEAKVKCKAMRKL